MPKRGLSVLLPLLFALTLVGVLFIGMRLQSEAGPVLIRPVDDEAVFIGSDSRVEEVLRYIDAKYVDSVDREKLVRTAIRSALDQLDPHSTFISQEDLQAITEQLEGNFDGIGVEFMMLDDTLVVVTPLAGGPAAAVGVQAGDKIVRIEDSVIAGVEIAETDIVNMLRGEKGSQVTVRVRRAGEPELLPFTIERDEIPVYSVDAAYMLDERTGYIKVNRFTATTYDEFMQGLERLIDREGMKNLVLDLRGNPGGYLHQATNLLSQLFTKRGKLLVYTQGRNVSRVDYESTGRAFYDIDGVTVLIDEGSASASEIVAGAIQDHDRGIIIGRRSFGKGLVQEQYPLSDGSALRLTISRYYTPSGRSIQKPYDREDPDAYNHDFAHRLENGALMEAEANGVGQDSTEAYYTDNGYVVYGGGGISPDVFVPFDTLWLNETYLRYRNQVPNFVFRLLEDRAADFAEYAADSDLFVETYQPRREIIDQFITYAREQAELPQPNARIRRELALFIKARLAKQLFDTEAQYRVLNQRDTMVQRALEFMREPNPLAAARDDQ
jgi:carboxyl-terminal processing protease